MDTIIIKIYFFFEKIDSKNNSQFKLRINYKFFKFYPNNDNVNI